SELLVGDDAAGPWAAIAEIETLRLGRAAERLPRALDELHALERERDAVLGQGDRGRQHAGAVHRAEALERGEPPDEVARRGARLRTAGQLLERARGRVRVGG